MLYRIIFYLFIFTLSSCDFNPTFPIYIQASPDIIKVKIDNREVSPGEKYYFTKGNKNVYVEYYNDIIDHDYSRKYYDEVIYFSDKYTILYINAQHIYIE